jgi:glycerophosphoryl diester phosphodiesterase
MGPGSSCTPTPSAGRHVPPAELRQGNPDSPVFLQAIGDFPAELRLFFDLGVDGIFTDDPDVAVAVRSTWAAADPPS